MLVFDSSALIAYLRDEPGVEMVQDLLNDADVPKYAHSVNLCEVFQKISFFADEQTARKSLATLRASGIEERNDMDAGLWQDAAQLVATQRRNGHGLSLGDSFCIALARRLNAEIVTGDHPEFDSIQTAQLARVVFFR